jgi:uncharacterized repeat protein (TIGR01451 family)
MSSCFQRLLLVLAVLPTVLPPAACGQAAAPLEVVQRFADNLTPGAAVPVELVVRNVSSQPVEAVQVLEAVPPGCEVREATPAPERSAEGLRWTVGRLAPGEERRFRLTLVPGGAGESLRNVVDVLYASRLNSVRTARVAGPDLAVELRLPEAAGVGSPANLTVTVRNRGAAPACNVSLQTVLPPGLTHPEGPDLELSLGTLASGAERIVPLSVTPTRSGSFPLRVTAQAEGGAPAVREAALVADDVRVSAAASGPAVLPQQLTGLFELTVRNEGSASCSLSVWVLLPEDMDFARASDGGGYDRQAHGVHWDLGEIRPAGRRVLAWNAVPRKAGEMTCRVRVLSRDRLIKESALTVRVVPGSAGLAD